MSDLKKFEGIVDDIWKFVFGTPRTKEVKPKRARTKKGTYKGDNKATKNVNEAWVGGKKPKKVKVKKARKK